MYIFFLLVFIEYTNIISIFSIFLFFYFMLRYSL
jgi:hypothetical protein